MSVTIEKSRVALLALVATASFQGLLYAAPAITATKDDGVAAGTRVARGGTVTYTNTITNTGTDATGVVYTDPDDPNAPTTTSTVSATAVAVDDTYPVTVLPNVGVNTATSSGFNVLTNDFLGVTAGVPVAASSLTLTCDTTSLNGGTVSMVLSGAGVGTFSYTPAAGFTGTDSFNYVLNSANGTTLNKTSKVTLTVGGPVIWFVNSTGGAGDGRLGSPFNSLAAFQALNDGVGRHPAANHVIFLYENATAYTGPVTLLNGQKLIGQDATVTLASFASASVPADSGSLPAMNAGVAPTAKITTSAASTNGVILNNAAGTNTVRGLTIGNTTGAGISGTSFGTLTVDDLSFVETATRTGQALALSTGTVNGTIANLVSSSATNGIALTSVGGSLTVTTGALSALSGADISISGGAGSLSYGGTISNSGGRSVDVQSHTGGTISLTGAITDTGTGINLASNTGTVFAFSGGITANTGANTAFSATGGGTVTVTGTNTIGATTALSAPGVNIANTTIGASGVTFRSVSVNSGANGIVLNTTGATGGFTITGDGNTSSGGNSSGGTIQNTSGHGISLNSITGVSLTNLNIQATQGSGINGTAVTNFTFANGTINSSGDAIAESNISFNGNGGLTGNNLSGTLSVTGSVLTNAFNSGIDLSNDAGTISNATITGNTITSSTSTATTKGYGISLVGLGNGSTSASLTKALIDSNTIRNFLSAGGIQVIYGNSSSGPGSNCGTPGSGTDVVTITNNVARGQNSTTGRMGTSAITVSVNGGNAGSRSTGNFNVSNNGTVGSPVGDCLGSGILIGNNGFATMTATVNNNVIVANNTVGSNGIGGGNGVVSSSADTPDLTLTVNGNNISQVDGNGILLVGRGVTGTGRLKIQNNTVAAPLTGLRPGIRVDAGNSSSVDDAMFVNISGNTSGGSGGQPGIGIRKQGTTATTNDFGIQGMVTSPATASQAEDYVSGLNPNSVLGPANDGVTNKRVLVISGSNYVTTSAVPLMAATGGIEAAKPVEKAVAVAPMDEVAAATTIQDTVAEVMAPAVEATPVAKLQKADDAALTDSQLQNTVEAAITRWTSTGLTPDQVLLLRGMRFEAADLPGMRLGEQGAGLIRVDRKAGGNGWYIDTTPLEDHDFTGASTRLYTTPAEQPAGRMDLLTAVLHEMGHALGLEDSYRAEDRDSLMYGYLTKGERRLPSMGQAEGAVPHDHDGGHFLTAPISIGTLPAGKSVVITATVTISNSISVGQISSQGTVTGTQSAASFSVLTDDPTAGGATDPTVTLVGIPPAITNAATTATFKVGTVGTFTFTATGIPTPTFSTASTLPGGVTLSSAGVLSGTPVAGSGGTYVLSVKAANTFLPDATQTFTLTVNEAPSITSANATTFTTGSAGSFTVTTGHSFPTALTLSSSGTLPAGVSFTDNGDGTATIAGTPGASAGGSYPLTLTANNGITPNATQSFTLNVNQASAFTSVNSTTFIVGSAGSFSVVTTGFPNAAITKTGTLPGGVTLTDNGNGTATLAGTPNAGTGGTYPITLIATNGVGSPVNQSFTLTVNQAPAITSANSGTFTVGSAGSFTLTTTGFPNSTISKSGALPTGVTFTDNGDGTATIAGTPAAATGGTYPLSITASNGVGTQATQSFTLTVNQAPAITSADNTSFTATVAGSFTVTTTGFPIGASMVIGETGTLPSGVTFVDNGNGTATLSGTPSNASAGNYPLTITANNGVSPQATQSFTLTVKPPVDHFTVSAPANATAGTAVNVTVTALDASNVVVPNYQGTVHFTSTDAQSTVSGLPANYTFTAGDNGVHVFSVTLKTAGTQTVSVNDVSTPAAAGTSGSIAVSAGADAKLVFVQQPSTAVAGVAIAPAVTVKVQDAYGNDTTGTPNVTLALGNPGSATLSGTLTQPAVAGVATFNNLSVDKVGTTYNLGATSGVLTGATSNNFTIIPAAATHYTVVAPGTATAGTAFNVTVTALDQFNNTATGYTGTAHFTSSDVAGTLPADGTLTNGVGTFSATLKTAGSRTITATDTVTGSITGTSAGITVGAGADAKLVFVQQPSTTVAGVSITPAVTVQIQDTFGNPTTSTSNVTVALGNAGGATLSGTATQPAVAGLATFNNLSVDKVGTTYNLGATSGILTGATSNNFTITPAAATHYTVVAPGTATAGTAFNVTVTALDAFNNTATGYTGIVHFTSTDGAATLPANYTFLAGDSGVHTFSTTLKTAGSRTITATDTVTGSITGTSNSVTVGAGADAKLVFVQQPSTTVAGVSIAPAVTVQIQDTFGNPTASTSNVTVALGNAGAATLTGTVTKAASGGLATFNDLKVDKVGTTYNLGATSGVLTGATSNTFTITPAAATHYTVVAPGTATAGTAFNVTVTALDQFNNTATGYAGTVHFTSTDGAATLPADSTLTSGVGTFSTTLKTAGSRTITATDTVTGSITGTSNSITVNPAAATHYTVSAPANATAGTAFNVTVTALDQFNNTATGYAGTVHFTSSDAAATLPANSTLTSGVGTFSATLKTAGSRTITATDTVTGSITGTSSGITVTAGADAKLVFVQQPSTTVAGVSIAPAVTVQIQDTFGNPTASTSNVTVALGNAGAATLTGTVTKAASGGLATFNDLKVDKVGTTYNLGATSGVLTGATSNNFTITPAAATHYTVSAPANATAGTAFNVTVTALDQFNNTATGYTGTAHFTSSDAAAVLPANSTLTNGVGTFSITLKTGGNQTITATDTVTGSITGTSGNVNVDPRSDLAVTVTDSPDPVNAGTNLTYTINVVNNGPSAAASVALSDTLPSGTTFVSLSSPGGWSSTTPAVGSGGTINSSKSTVAPGETASFTLVVKVAASVINGTVLSNTATVSTTTTELSGADNSATATTTVTASADLAVTVTDSPDPVTAGTNLTYTITASNAGPSDATSVSLSDTLPAGTTFVSATTPGGWSATTPAVGSGGTVTYTRAVFANAASDVFTVVVKVNSSVAAGTVLSNTASVSASSTDPTPGNNSGTATTTVSRSADLALTVVDTPDPVNATENITYTATVINNGPSDAQNASLTFPFPATVTFVSASTPSGWVKTSTNNVGDGTGTVTYTATSVAAAASSDFAIVFKVNATAPNNSHLATTVTVTSATTDPASGNNTVTTDTLVKSGADLVISGSASTPAIAGSDVTYTFTATNNGPLDANNAVVTSVLPVGTTFLSAVTPSGWTLDGSSPAVGSNGTVTFTRPLFANTDTANFTVVARINANVASGTALHNGIAAASSTLDVFPLNNSASLDSSVVTRADLAVTLDATPNPVLADANLTYTITVANNGPSDATGASVSLPLAASTTFLSATGSGWTISSPAVGTTGTVTFSAGAITHGTSATLTVVTKVVHGTANGSTISATATASGGSDLDPNLANNSGNKTVEVGTVDPTVLQLATTGTLNRQTGLFELNVKVTNTTPHAINGFRLHVDYSSYLAAFPSLRLWNATSLTPAPYVDYPYPVAIDAEVNVKLVFYTSTRTFPAQFSPILTVEALPTSQTSDTNGAGVQATAKKLLDGTVLIEFPSVVGHWYRVRYSSDMTNWRDCPVPLQAGGSKTQWIDSGAPFTNVSPADPSVTSRFYIVNEIPAP